MTDLKTQSEVIVFAKDEHGAKELARLNDYSSGKVTNAKNVFDRLGSSIHDETLFNLIGEEVFEWGTGHHEITCTPGELKDHDILSNHEITINFIINRAEPDVGLMSDYISDVTFTSPTHLDLWEVLLTT